MVPIYGGSDGAHMYSDLHPLHCHMEPIMWFDLLMYQSYTCKGL